MFCANCGQELKETQKFCGNCGAPNVKYKKPSELSEIVKKATEGDSAAMEQIYERTYRKGYSVAIQMTKNEQDALDLLQDAYISAFRNLGSLQNPEKLSSWFNCIVSNRCKDWLKKKKPQLFTEITPEDSDGEFEDTIENEQMEFSPEESVDYEETKRLMKEILDGLPEDQRLCVLMYYYDELSVTEIAEALECSDGTVKSRLNYARKKIKTEVEALEKKGTKLYSVAPIPFLVWMLRTGEQQATLPVEFAKKVGEELAVQEIAKSAAHQATQEAAKSMAQRAAQETAKSTAEQAAQETVKSTAGQAAQEAVKNTVGQTATQAAKGTAEQVAKGAVKKGAKYLAAKIAVGVVSASVVGAGGYTAYSHQKDKAAQEAGVTDTAKEKKAEEFEMTQEQMDMIRFASMLFDQEQKEKDGYETRKDYVLDLSDNQIPEETLKNVTSGLVNVLADDGKAENKEGNIETTLSEKECKKFLKNTLNYEVEKTKDLNKLFDGSEENGYTFSYREAEKPDTLYNTMWCAQTGENGYHFYIEVEPYSNVSNAYDMYSGTGIMDITAHKDDSSAIAGYVFDKIEFKSKNEAVISENMKDIMNGMIRVKTESAYSNGEIDDPMKLDPAIHYDVNEFSNEEFVSYANYLLTMVDCIGKEKEEKDTEDGVYDGMIISEEEYKNVCENTLGRTEAYDETVLNTVEDGRVHYYGRFYDTWYTVNNARMIQKLDGKISVTGTITYYTQWNDGEGTPYTYTMTGRADDNSEMGFVIDQADVKKMEKDSIEFSDGQIQMIAHRLGIPSDKKVAFTAYKGEYERSVGGTTILVEYAENDTLLAARAKVDLKSGEFLEATPYTGDAETSLGSEVLNNLNDSQKGGVEIAARLFYEGEQKVDGEQTSYTLDLQSGKTSKALLRYVSSGIACMSEKYDENDMSYDEILRRDLRSEECQELLESTFDVTVNGWDGVRDIYPSAGNATSARMGLDLFALQYEAPNNGIWYTLTKALQNEDGTYTFTVEIQREDQAMGVLQLKAHEKPESLFGGFVFDEISYQKS